MENFKQEILKLQLSPKLTLQYLSTDRYVGGYIAITGNYEPFERDLLLNLLNEGDIAVDVGANIGVYTLNIAQRVGATGKVYAFEPEPTNFELLMKNVRENNLTNVICSEFALSNQATLTSLFISKENFGDHQLYQGNPDRKSIPVMADTLDNLLRHTYKEEKSIKVIKIDTQGFEPFVIEGAKHIIQENQPAIFLEYWPDGFKNSSADHHAMIDFLVNIYGNLYLIDEGYKKIIATNQDFIDEYCRRKTPITGKEDLFCNIAFFSDASKQELASLYLEFAQEISAVS